MTCKNCPYYTVEIECGNRIVSTLIIVPKDKKYVKKYYPNYCSLQGSDPAEYPEGCYKAVRREED